MLELKSFIKKTDRQTVIEILLWLVLLLILSGSIILIGVSGKFTRYLEIRFYQEPLTLIPGIFILIHLIFITVSALFYRKPPENLSRLPSCTVIVPAYNEGPQVAETLKSLLAADYPAEKMEIIAVNDGSQDDTLYWINSVRNEFPYRIKVIDLPVNHGKKYALYTAFHAARHEFLITVDSDSLIGKESIRQLLIPFADPAVGAVAGAIGKKAKANNFHVWMFDVMLVFGCGFLRKGQSLCNNVMCTPGALSAYRKSAVIPVSDQWLAQTFLGVPAKIGEDRAIATLLLNADWQIAYNEEARAETTLPVNYAGVCRMLLRWTRSDIRENLVMAKPVCRNLFKKGWRGINLFILWFLLTASMFMPLLFLPAWIITTAVYRDFWHIQTASLVLVSLIWSIPSAVVYYREKRSLRSLIWCFWSGFYGIFTFSWIAVYALFTLRDSRWMTRELKMDKSIIS